MYEVLFYNGWQDAPAYYLVSAVEGRSPKAALRRNLEKVIREVRDRLDLGDDVEDRFIRESLYVIKSDALVPARALG